ncbi:MAG TPA: LysR family transcriptional regulator [Gaiellales bacterium]
MTVPPDPLSGRELAAFVAAVDAHTLHAAADALALTQSAVTKRIAALERRVGKPLLERGRTGVRPTAAGRALYPEARAALASLERARRTVADSATATALAVAASHTVAGYLLPGWLAGFRAERGGLRIAVEVVNSPGVIAAVRARRAELGFVEGIDALDGLESQMLRSDVLECVVRPGHRFARRVSIRPAELIDEPWIAREPGSGTRAVAERALRERSITLVPALEAASTEGLKRAVHDGGFALLSRLAVEEEVTGGTLVAVPVAELDLRRELRVVRLDSHAGPASALWDWLRAHAPHR